MKKSTKKKIIVVLGVFVGVGLIVWFGIFRKVGRFDTLQAVPVDAVFKVNIVSVNSVHEQLHRNFIWKSLKNYPYFEEYHSNLQYVDSLAKTYPKLKRILTDRPVTISCHQVGLNKYDFLYVCDLGKLNVIQVFETLLLKLVQDDEIKIKTIKDPNGEIREIRWADWRFFFTIKDNLLIGSSSHALVARSLARCKTNKEVQEVVVSGDIMLDLDHRQLGKWVTSVMEDSAMADEFSLLKNTRLMMQLNDKSLRFVGETRPDPNKYSLLDVVSFLEGGSSNLETIAVENTAAYVSFCFPSFKEAENLLLENYKVNDLQSYTEMKRSLDRLNKFLNIDVLEVFTSWIGGEVAIIKPRLENDQKADHIVLAIRSKEIHLAKDQMAYLAEQIQWRTPIRERVMEFNGHTIHYFRLKGFFQLFFGGMFERFERPYYTFLGDYVVFSNSPAPLAKMIKEYVLGNTLENDEKHMRLKGQLGSRKNVFGYVQTPNTYEYLYDSFKAGSQESLEKNRGAFLSFETIGFSLSKERGVFETQIIANYNDKAPEEYRMRELNRQFENQINKIEAGFYYPVIPDSIAVSDQGYYECESEQAIFKGALKNGEPDGVWYVFNVAGKLLGQLPYGDGKIDGVAPFFYENGDLLAQVTYKNGLIAGYKEFFLDGTLRAEIAYRKGVRHGTAKFYYNTGHLFCEGRYKKGRQTGKWRYYKVTGEKLD